MKSVCFFFIAFLFFGFSSNTKQKIPPGTVKITNQLYFDITEISNFSWLEYVYSNYLKYGPGSPEYLSCLPDTGVWLQGEFPIPEYVSNYFRSPKYREYPVVGISHEQAINFCKWRTSMVKMFYALAYKTDWNIEYRLPTKEEWEMVAYYETGKITDFKKAVSQKCNLKSNETELNIVGKGPALVNSFNKGLFGQYNLIGNVAEMLNEKNTCKGGSWLHYPEESRVGKAQIYLGPVKWLGFRCVCVVNKAIK